MTSNLAMLITKLNPACRKAAERAASLCSARGHYEVDLEHLFLALLEQSDCDFAVLAHYYNIDVASIERDFAKELDNFKRGNTRTPVLSPHLVKLFEHAWLLASLETDTGQIRSGHLLLALLTEMDLAQLARRMSVLFAKFPVDALKHKLETLTQRSAEASVVRERGGSSAGEMPEAAAAAPKNPRPALDQFTTDLTKRAREGHIDPVIGREAEVRQVIDILMRRRQNNPILTGEAGVGKTAIVEGLALRIAEGDVPESLHNVALHVLDLGLLQAGASVKGEFENRLKNVIREVKSSSQPIILFIDEAHTMIGAGGQTGQNDAANLLKPALARGELRTIAATTWSEYKKYFEKDAALARRFQVVKVEEPSEEVACAMLRAIAAPMERHFNIRVLDEAIVDAVRLSSRYLTGRQLPDKAISVLDTACARVALGQSSRPPALENAEKRRSQIVAEMEMLKREQSTSQNAQHAMRLQQLDKELEHLNASIESTVAQWSQEKRLAAHIAVLREEVEAESRKPPSLRANKRMSSTTIRRQDTTSPKLAQLEEARAALRTVQGESPIMSLAVDALAIGEVISGWTGIPLGKMVKDEVKTVLAIDSLLMKRVIGQDHAVKAIAQRVKTARANLEDPHKPKGVFLFVGPSGVGKTETALALADILYGGERNLITINMSEYQEAHSVSGLKGSPPGYVGFGEGGVLTEAVRRKPYSVVLLDEVEKAHPDVLELFFQVFDKGFMDDAEGREIDFKNTIIILTSNVGSASLMRACLNKTEEDRPGVEALLHEIRPQLYQHFKPAFLGRLNVIPFYPLSDQVLADIIALKLEKIRIRIAENHQARCVFDRSLAETILSRCTEADSGARNIDHIVNSTLLPEIADSVLKRIASGEAIQNIKIGTSRKGEITYRVT